MKKQPDQTPITLGSIVILGTLLIIGLVIHFGSRDMPPDYYSKKILEGRAQSEELLLKQYLPDSIYTGQ